MEKLISTGYNPRELQDEIHKALKRFNILVLHRRFGKCHTEDTLLYTKNGPVKIIDYDGISDVYGPDGKLRKVTGKYTVPDQEVYRVYFDSGVFVETNNEHLWYVEPPLSLVPHHKRKLWECGEIRETQRLIDINDEWFIPISSAVEFPVQELEIEPWLFGYWLGNGDSKGNRVCVSNADSVFFAEKTKTTPAPANIGAGCVYFTTKILKSFRDLYDLERCGKHIPQRYLYSSIAQRWELLRGLMDSDGTVSQSGTCRFDNKNEQLIDDTRELVQSLGMKCSKACYNRGEEREFYLLFRAVGENPFSLQRKSMLVQFARAANRHKIIKVEKTSRVEDMYCISLADDTDHLYVTNGFIATHNTVLAINEIIDRGLTNPLKNPQYAYFAPFHGQAKRVAWEYMKEYTKNFPGIVVNEAELRVDIPRPNQIRNDSDKIRFLLLGADNPTAIRGMYFDGVVLDEFAEMDPQIWTQVLRPTLSDRNGWALFIGTPRGQNHFYDVWQLANKDTSGNWYSKMFKASETGIIAKSELLEAQSMMSPEEYEQEFECSFTAALVGAYYGKEMEAAEKENPSRISKVPYDPSIPVDTAWDLGIGDTTVIWFMQQVGREFRAIDYVEDSGRGMDYYAKILKDKRYVYREHYLPHDAAAKELGTGRSREETLRSLGVSPTRIVPRQSIEDGINACRMLIPKFWFDGVKCERGIACLKNYERMWDAKNKIYSSKPLHNWASHGADAFRSFAMGMRDNTVRTNVKHLPRISESDYDILG